ncbi:MAG: ABC transporter ATP-binding protein [Planctomycetaceae bacterium]|nr:ABC transporter ATP-binding protein [Planctomycetaceae bacterium]
MSTFPCVEFDNVTKRFPVGLLGRRKVTALDRVSLTVAPGDVYGIIGPNRAGKSTLVKLLLTICRPTSGRITRLGRHVRDRATLARVGYVHEQQVFPIYLTPRALLRQYGALSFVPRIELAQRIDELLDLVGLDGWEEVRIGCFSKGMFQRLALAQALLNDPELLVLDEPTEGLDLAARRVFHEIVRRRQGAGRTSVVISHHLADIQRLCNRILVLRDGQVAYEGPVGLLTSVTTPTERDFEAAVELFYAEATT